MLLIFVNQTCPKLWQSQRCEECRGPLMCPITPYLHKFIRKWKLILHHCHMTPGAAVPKVVWINLEKLPVYWGKESDFDVEEVGVVMSPMAGFSRKRAAHFATIKKTRDFPLTSPKFLPTEAPANPSQNLCMSLSTLNMSACLNSAVRHVSPYLPSAFSSCSLCHPHDNSANLHFSWQNFFPFC